MVGRGRHGPRPGKARCRCSRWRQAVRAQPEEDRAHLRPRL